MNMKLHNLSSSSRNPIKLGTLSQYIVEGWADYSDHRVKLNIHEKKWQRKLYNMRSNVPKEVKNRLAHFLDMKSWKIESQQESITVGKKKEIVRKYKYFFEREWICESNKSIDYFNYLSHEDQILFHFNVNSINWKTYAKLCCYSIKKYLLGIKVEQFSPSNLDLLNLQKSSYFSDILWAITEGKNISAQTSNSLKKYIMSTKSVKDAIEGLV